MKNTRTLAMAQLALFSAIIVILTFTPFVGYIPLGITRATIIHIPVIIGSILLGPKKGAFLGFVFGLTSLLNNTINPTITSFTFTPFYAGGNLWSLVVCFVPRILVGVVPYFVYLGVKKLTHRETLPLMLSGLAGSMTNTVLVMGMIWLFFGNAYAQAKAVPVATLYQVILGVVGVNGVLEAIVAAILTAAVTGALLRFLRGRTGKTV